MAEKLVDMMAYQWVEMKVDKSVRKRVEATAY